MGFSSSSNGKEDYDDDVDGVPMLPVTKTALKPYQMVDYDDDLDGVPIDTPSSGNKGDSGTKIDSSVNKRQREDKEKEKDKDKKKKRKNSSSKYASDSSDDSEGEGPGRINFL
jgi:hypothetical protein